MVSGMGTLHHGSATEPIHIEDRALANLKVVIATKLRRQESFTLSWRHPEGEPAAGRPSGCTLRSRCDSRSTTPKRRP